MTIELVNRRSMRLRRLLTVATVALAFSATPAMADPLSCVPFGSDEGFQFGPPSDSAAFACEIRKHDYSPTTTSNTYEYNEFFFPQPSFAFTNELSFTTVLRDFTLYLTAYYIDPAAPGDFLDRIPDGYEPETFATTFGPAWIYFRTEDLQDSDAEPTQGVDYSGAWFQDILWYGDGNYNDPQVLHDPDGGDFFFGDVITVPGSFDPEPTPPCESEYGCDPPPPPCIDCLFKIGDPRIVGTADDFRNTTVVSNVPEPTTLWLLGLGAAGVVARARRRLTR